MTKLIPPLSLSEVAKNLGISRPTLYQMISDKRFDAKPVKGSYPRKWAIDVVEQWANENGYRKA